jgi:pSer/pThr/pTyr-binding forkhead associated (FHA) protein
MPIAESDPRLERVGFAKILGESVDYIVRKYSVVLGRRSKVNPDVVLGDLMSISRQHARISFNFETKHFELSVLGKNGVTVDGVTKTSADDPVALRSQSVLQIGPDITLYFLLPKDPTAIFPGIKKRK